MGIRKSIWIDALEKRLLERLKEQVEVKTGAHYDWGSFLIQMCLLGAVSRGIMSGEEGYRMGKLDYVFHCPNCGIRRDFKNKKGEFAIRSSCRQCKLTYVGIITPEG